MPCFMISVIYKTENPSYLKKLRIIQNTNNLMFQVIFKFSDWILIKQIIVTFIPYYCWGMGNFSLPRMQCLGEFWGEGEGAWVKIPRFSALFGNINTTNLNFFFNTWWNIKVWEKIQLSFWRERKSSRDFIEIWKDVSFQLILKDGNQHFLPFC